MSDQANFQGNVAELRKPTGTSRRFGKATPGTAGSATGMASAKDGPEALRQQLHKKVKAALAEPKLHEDETQYELSCWVRLIDTTEDRFARATQPGEALRRLLRQAEAAIEALRGINPELLFARTLRYRAEMELRRHGGWASRSVAKLSDGDPAVLVGAGVFLIMAVGMTGFLIVNWLAFGVLSLGGPMAANGSIVPALQAAFLGGGVSILARLREFSCARIRDFDPFLLFWNGLFNPIVGMIFATFVYAALKSGVVPLEAGIVEKITSAPGLWTIGFLTGFSERFTSDVIARAENALGVKKQA
jgi:hypothetical protein